MIQVVFSVEAKLDVAFAGAHYQATGAADVVEQLFRAIDRGVEHLRVHPYMGSPRYADQLDIEGLRVWPVLGFPFLICYVPGPDIHVVRVLHAHRDLPKTLRSAEFS